MSTNQTQFRKSAQRFFTAFDRWAAAEPALPNLYRGGVSPEELLEKCRRFPKVITAARDLAATPIDDRQDWDLQVKEVTTRMVSASLYYLFTGDRKALVWAEQALAACERCERPSFCYSVCVGHVDVDLRTAATVHALACMRSCFADIIDRDMDRRLCRQAIDRGLRPGLDALRERRYWWTQCRTNWRSVMTGSLGVAAMAFADEFPDWRELVDYGIEGVLTILEDGDRCGGWNEGPAYWEYGVSHCAEFAWFLRSFTSGKVNLFAHRYLKKTGDFPVYMMPANNRYWNWSDGHKAAVPSQTLTIVARVYGNHVYQGVVLRHGTLSIRQLYYINPGLKGATPSELEALPMTKTFPDLGVVVMRTGFKRDDAYVGVKGGGMGGNIAHEHLDMGSVFIQAGGRELLAELDHWKYAQATGKAGGFFDRAGTRWDYDFNAALGHNLVGIGDRYPRFVDGGFARTRHIAVAPGIEAVLIDSTPFYRPLCRRVRRLVIYRRPDLVILIDDLWATEPIRGQCMFHYLDTATVQDAGFTLRSGRAALRGWSLYPTTDDNVICGQSVRKIAYHTELGLENRINQYVYLENLHRTRHVVFATALLFGRVPLVDTRVDLTGDPREGAIAMVIRRPDTEDTLHIDNCL